MITKPSRLALLAMALGCAAIPMSRNCAPRLQFATVAPLSAEIYVSGGAGAGVRGAARSENSLASRQAPRGGSATASGPTGVVLAVD
jgi:hypothetical protein